MAAVAAVVVPDPQSRKVPYAPRNPYPTPPYFPTHPAPVFDDPAMFEKFDIDTLFFIFYFQQGTHQQYLAGRELKKQSWRYHKNFLTWFQRHEDPTVTTPAQPSSPAASNAPQPHTRHSAYIRGV